MAKYIVRTWIKDRGMWTSDIEVFDSREEANEFADWERNFFQRYESKEMNIEIKEVG